MRSINTIAAVRRSSRRRLGERGIVQKVVDIPEARRRVRLIFFKQRGVKRPARPVFLQRGFAPEQGRFQVTDISIFPVNPLNRLAPHYFRGKRTISSRNSRTAPIFQDCPSSFLKVALSSRLI